MRREGRRRVRGGRVARPDRIRARLDEKTPRSRPLCAHPRGALAAHRARGSDGGEAHCRTFFILPFQPMVASFFGRRGREEERQSAFSLPARLLASHSFLSLASPRDPLHTPHHVRRPPHFRAPGRPPRLGRPPGRAPDHRRGRVRAVRKKEGRGCPSRPPHGRGGRLCDLSRPRASSRLVKAQPWSGGRGLRRASGASREEKGEPGFAAAGAAAPAQ